MPTYYTLISSGFAVSPTVDLNQENRVLAIGVPGVTSGDLLLQGSFSTTSADFQRLLETRGQGSGDLRFAVGPGSRMVTGPLIYAPPYIRAEMSVNQTDNRTLTLLTARW